MKTFLRRVYATVNRPRVMHYLDIFVAGTGTALYYNRDRLLGAHGLNLVGSIVFGACVAGLKAVIEAFRKSGNLPPAPPAASK